MYLHTIPKLYCPFPSTIHPKMVEIEEHTNQWVLDFHLIHSPEMLNKYREQRFAAMISRSYPYGDHIDLAAWCDLNTLLFIVDDQLDEQDLIRDEESFLNYERDFLDVLENNRKCTIEKDGPVLTALNDFWSRMLLRSGDIWQQKFIQGIKDMFAGGLWQFNLIANHKKPELNEYMEIRQYLGAANLATDSLGVMGQVLLTEETYEHPLIRRVTEICRNAVCFANDLFSLGKEIDQSNGADFNLVTILQRKHDLTIDQAIKETAMIHDNHVEEFIRISEKSYIFDNSTNSMLEKYIHALEYLMKGNIDWSTRDTTRYPHKYAD
jgi:Terpene synthase family 2, C-terminal metal binding